MALNETKIKDLFHPKVGIPVIFNAKDYPELANDFYELINSLFRTWWTYKNK